MKDIISADEEVITGFERISENFPEKTALVYLGETFSYRQLRDLIYRFATALHELGVRKNDKVLIYIPNCPQWIIAYFGVQKIGAVPVPTSPIYTPFEISYQLNDCGAETVICQDTNFGYMTEVFPKTPLKRVIVTNLVDLLPRWKKAVGWFFNRIPHGAVEKSENVYLLKELLRKHHFRIYPGLLEQTRGDRRLFCRVGRETMVPDGRLCPLQ